MEVPALTLILLLIFEIKSIYSLTRPRIVGKQPVVLTDAPLDPPELIEKYGFQAETHHVLTEDGYYLNLFRIKNESGPPVLLSHGVLLCSTVWLLPTTGTPMDSLGKRISKYFKKSQNFEILGLLLAQNGFDVWLFNSRGGLYSLGHLNLSINSIKYWDFSLDEQAQFDIPACIDVILSKSKFQKLSYVGYSMGAILFFKCLASKPQYNDKINTFIGYGSTAGYLGNSTTPISLINHFLNTFKLERIGVFMGDLLFGGKFPPLENVIKSIAQTGYKLFCGVFGTICDLVLNFLVGQGSNQIVDNLLIVLLNKNPTSTSVRTWFHIFQEVDNTKYPKIASQYYNFGWSKNLEIYGFRKHPEYNLKNIKIPIFLFSGRTDGFIDYKDSLWTALETRGPVKQFVLGYGPQRLWNHADYLYSKLAPKILYFPTIEILKNFTKIRST